MKKRDITILVAILVILGGIYLVSERPFGSDSREAMFDRNLLLPNMSVERASAMAIRGTGGSLTITNDGSGWMVEAAERRYADEDKIDDALRQIAELSRSELVSIIPDKHAVFEVDDDRGTRVTVTAGGDTVLADVVLGKPGPDFISSYVRLADEDEVYLSGSGLTFALRPEAAHWRDRRLMRFVVEDVTTFSIDRDGVRLAVGKLPDGGWTIISPTESAADAPKVELVLRQLGNLTASGHADDKTPALCGLDLRGGQTPTATVTVESLGIPPQTIHVGVMSEENYYVRRGDREVIYELVATIVDRILVSQDELVAEPPEAADR